MIRSISVSLLQGRNWRGGGGLGRAPPLDRNATSFTLVSSHPSCYEYTCAPPSQKYRVAPLLIVIKNLLVRVELDEIFASRRYTDHQLEMNINKKKKKYVYLLLYFPSELKHDILTADIL